MFESKRNLSLECPESFNMAQLYKDLPLPMRTYIYVLYMDALGRMPAELPAVLKEIDNQTVIANIISVSGKLRYLVVYKKNSSSIVYDIKGRKIEIKSNNWEDFFKDKLLSCFFSVLTQNKERLTTTKIENLTSEWWLDKDRARAKVQLEAHKKNIQNKAFITEFIVATMDQLDISIDDIQKIREQSDYKLLYEKYTGLLDDLVELK